MAFPPRRETLSLAVPWVAAWLSAAVIAMALATGARAAQDRPNVLFIAVDDLNDWIGCLGGHPQSRTPNFDRLARRGTLFTRAYCTAPACNPSRKSLLLGLRPSTTGLYYSGKRIRDVLPDAVTLPEHFKRNGYRIEGGGKIFHSGMNDPQSWHAYFQRPKDPEPKKKPHVGLGDMHQYWRWQALVEYRDADMGDAKLAAWAEEFLRREHGQPFFLGVGFFRPHMPWHVPQKHFDPFPIERIELPRVKQGDVDDLPGYARWLAHERTGFHAAVLKRNEWHRAVQAYLACIAFCDAQLGRLLDALDASPYAQNTIVVLWSDNGMHLGEKQHWTKWALWEQATRVPLCVAAPGVGKPGSRCDVPVSLLDLYPTLIELCELPEREPLEGESLVPLLRDPRAPRTAPAITTHGHLNHAVRTGRWRYIRYRDGSEELYDHQRDSHEWTNLAGDPQHAETLARLRAMLPKTNVPDPPFLDRKQYWPGDPSPDDTSDCAASAAPAPRRVAAKPAAGRGDYDLVVVGATPGGIACAVRAARRGMNVLLTNHTQHVGGMMLNGLVQWDTLYGGRRGPFFDELIGRIEDYYRKTYGEGSREYQTARLTHEHYPTGMVEPHVIERIFNELIAAEPRLTLRLGVYPAAVEREGALLTRLTLQEFGGEARQDVSGRIFVDATYEGDLAALAEVPYRVGREGRAEYGESMAGKVFTRRSNEPAPTVAVEGRLNIQPRTGSLGGIDPASPGTADRAIQAYNFRPVVTRDPANRVRLTEPPPNYRRERYLNYHRKYLGGHEGPNGKSTMNSPILPGENHDYPEADWPTRTRIFRHHVDFALGLMWFLQNDPSVPGRQRERFRHYGFPKDEYVDNNHVPYEMYVREARRIVGRYVYTQHDNSLAPGIDRAPINGDSITFTDWYMDSHSCTMQGRPGYPHDGKLEATHDYRPGQIPYRCLLPKGVDNLLVPVCLSATHVAWGAVRLEPVWICTGDAAGMAAALATEQRVPPASLNPDRLLRELVEAGFIVSFLNDADAPGHGQWGPAVQYFGTKGFFPTYDSRPDDPLDEPTARLWARGLAGLEDVTKKGPGSFCRDGPKGASHKMDQVPFSFRDLARSLMAIEKERKNAKEITAAQFIALWPAPLRHNLPKAPAPGDAPLSRGRACQLMYRASSPPPSAPHG